MIIDGRKIAEELINGLKEKFAREKQRKFLAVFCAGENSAMESFVNQKEKTARELGIDFRVHKFSEEITQDELRKEASKIVLHKTCGGAIVQLPLPNHINPQYVLNAIPREKDIDVLGERALGAFYAGRNPVLPPAVGVVEEILRDANIRMHTNDANEYLKNKNVAVVGLGFLVGKPVATWFMGKALEIYLLDKGSDFRILEDADVVICGAGVPGLIKPEMLKNDALVIDFGYSRKQMADGEWQIAGDFDSLSLETGNWKPRARTDSARGRLEISYTPTPGGTGPILVAKLFENFYTLVHG